MRNNNNEKYESIKKRKTLSSLTQLEKDYLMNSQRQKTKIILKTENNSRYNPKSELFNYFMNLRYDKVKNIYEKKDYDDFLFEGSPVPGYYSPENNYTQSDNFSKYDKSKKNLMQNHQNLK